MSIYQKTSKSCAKSCGFIAVAGLALWAQTGFAAMIGSDNASNTVYSSGWTNGSNGGTGFGAWSLSTPSSASYFFAQSSTVGDGSGGHIDTSSISWGMAGGINGGNTTNQSAARSFVAGADGHNALEQGQTFSLNFQNNFVNSSSSYVGYSLDNSSGQSLFSIFFQGGGSTYQINTSPSATGASALPGNGGGWTNSGVDTSFTLNSPTSYTFTFQELNSSALVTETGTVGGPITGFTAFDTGNAAAYSTNNYYLYLNSVSIAGTPAPEPATIGLLGCGGAALLMMRRRRT